MMIDAQTIDEVISDGPYNDTWESLTRHTEPKWFGPAKFGIFSHWGLYTVPEYGNEWYSRNMYIQGTDEFRHHVETFGPQREFGYKDFIPMFTAAAFDPNEWLDIFKDSGAQYFFPVAEHHDGFQMYNSELSQWNTVQMGPHRDILGELRRATVDHGLHFAASNHRAEHWWFMGHGKEFDSDIRGPLHRGDFYWPAMPEAAQFDVCSKPYPTQEYLEDWLLRVCELIDGYRPEMLYFDWWIQHESFKPYVKRMAAFYYNRAEQWGIPVTICYKNEGMAWGAGIFDVERGGFDTAKPYVWQTDTSIARNSWCYTKDLDYKSVSELVITLIDTVSKNGNLLLNVGPCADGSIGNRERITLSGIGSWLRTNGDGIYGSEPWKVAHEGPTSGMNGSFADAHETVWTHSDFRFTAKHGSIYIFCLNPEMGSQVCVSGFAQGGETSTAAFQGVVREVEQLGAGPVAWWRDGEGMHITPSSGSIRCDATSKVGANMPVCFKVSIE